MGQDGQGALCLLCGTMRRTGGRGGCLLAHSPLELLPTPGQVLGFIPHQVQDGASRLLLEGPRSPTDAQAAEEGWGQVTGSMGSPPGPTHRTPDPASH